VSTCLSSLAFLLAVVLVEPGVPAGLTEMIMKKPTVPGWILSASRVFPVDDSARVESS